MVETEEVADFVGKGRGELRSGSPPDPRRRWNVIGPCMVEHIALDDLPCANIHEHAGHSASSLGGRNKQIRISEEYELVHAVAGRAVAVHVPNDVADERWQGGTKWIWRHWRIRPRLGVPVRGRWGRVE